MRHKIDAASLSKTCYHQHFIVHGKQQQQQVLGCHSLAGSCGFQGYPVPHLVSTPANRSRAKVCIPKLSSEVIESSIFGLRDSAGIGSFPLSGDYCLLLDNGVLQVTDAPFLSQNLTVVFNRNFFWDVWQLHSRA
jgi:hypothetical protein